MIELCNAIDVEKALEVRQAFINADYDSICQERKTTYTRDFNECHPTIPNNDESYTSNFCRANYLEKTQLIKDSYLEHIAPLIEKTINIKICSYDLRCYKMIEGGHFRIHKDEYVADYGFIWYLSRCWKWDWGGLLLSIKDDYTAAVAIPEFNKLVIMEHRNGLTPHCVTPITSYAKEPRIMLVGFLR